MAGQLDCRDVAVGARDDAGHSCVDDVHAARPQGVELGVVDVGGVMEHDGELGAQLAEQPGGVQAQGVGDDLDDAPVADLEAVTERTVDHVAAPVLGEPVDVGELVDHAGGRKDSTGDDGVTADELDTESLVAGAGDPTHPAGEDLTAVAAHLLATQGGELRGRPPFVAEVAVHVCGRGVARLAGVDDDHRAALASELQCGREPGGRSADDGDVAVSLEVVVAWSLMRPTIR